MNMTAAVRDEGLTIYQRMVAHLCRPGQSKKEMDNVVHRALGGYPLWRVRACRLGEAGPFSAAAILDLQQRYLRWREAEVRRAASQAQTEAQLRAERTRAELEAARNEHRSQLARIERQLASCETALRLSPADEARP